MKKVCSIVVTYNPDIEEFFSFLRNNKNEVDYVIIVDNSDNIEIQAKLRDLNTCKNIEVIQLLENRGIAAAQNIGIERAKIIGEFDFILFLDQDSMLYKGTINSYKSFYKIYNEKLNIAAIGVGSTSEPLIQNEHIDKKRYKSVSQLVSSGTFSPIYIFNNIGYFDENLFIDFVEYDWCWRAIDNNYSIISLDYINLIHTSGNGKVGICKFKMTNPAPIRHYYQYRNLLFLLKRPYVPSSWKIKMIIKTIIKTPLYLTILDNRTLRAKYITKGIASFFKGSKGKI